MAQRVLRFPLRAHVAARPIAAPPEPEAAPRVTELEHAGLRLVTIERAQRADVEQLGEQFGFHPLALEDVLSRIQRPKIDEYDGYLFIVIQLPVFDHSEDVSVPSELDCFLGPDYLVIAHAGDLKRLNRVLERLQEEPALREEWMTRGAEHLLYRILDALVTSIFTMVTRIDRKLERLEDEVFKGDPRRVVGELARARRDVIAMRRIIQPNTAVIARLEGAKLAGLHEEMGPYWGDVSDGLRRLWDDLAEFKEIVEALDASYSTLYSFRTNEALKLLTVISTVMLPLTLVSGVYGMNVGLPGAEEPWVFAVIVLAMLLIFGTMLGYFRWKRWL